MTRKIKIKVTKGITVTIDPRRMATDETARQRYAELIRKAKSRIEAELARRYPTAADFEAEVERTKRLLYESSVAIGYPSVPEPQDHTAHKSIIDAAMLNATVSQLITNSMPYLRAKLLKRRGARRYPLPWPVVKMLAKHKGILSPKPGAGPFPRVSKQMSLDEVWHLIEPHVERLSDEQFEEFEKLVTAGEESFEKASRQWPWLA
jgi:hypothetical protein